MSLAIDSNFRGVTGVLLALLLPHPRPPRPSQQLQDMFNDLKNETSDKLCVKKISELTKVGPFRLRFSLNSPHLRLLLRYYHSINLSREVRSSREILVS